jgi:SAM-dependent methyltransferase
MSGYSTLVDVYEWLIPEEKLDPAGATAAVSDVVAALPAGARVLDCACGTGQLAVGLAQLGLIVEATDASLGMVRRTQTLAEAHGVSVSARAVAWADLNSHLPGSTFDMVFCVGNSLGHAEGAKARVEALEAMARRLKPGGRLVLTSRNWELVRAKGTRMDVWGQVVRREAVDGVVIYNWQISDSWQDEHHLEIGIAQVFADGSVVTHAERLSIWPFAYDQLLSEMDAAGLSVTLSDFDPAADGYRVVALRASPER